MPAVTCDITHTRRAGDNGFGPVREPGRNQRNQPMIASRAPRAVSLTLASAALLGILVFLFVRTQSVDFKAEAHALALLREIKDLDARWDADALELAREVAPSMGNPVADRGALMSRLLRELERGTSAQSIATTLPVLRRALTEKSAAFTALRAAHQRALDAPGPRTLEAVARTYQAFAFQTLGARVDLGAKTLVQSIEADLDEQDRWRAYLAAYAAALLVGMAYLGSRVVATQRALIQANEQLERRVAERTAELTQAMGRLKESEAQLVQTEKMSSLGQLVAGVAHEINTPLAYVKNSVASTRDRLPQLRQALEQSQGLLAMLESESPSPEELQAAFGALAMRLQQLTEHQVLQDLDALTRDGLHGIEQISELVNNLRNFARLDRSKVASYNVNDSVVSTLLIARSLLRKIDIEKRLGEVPSITCSPSQVNQVLLNLVTNAAQAMLTARGHIIVTTRREGNEHVAIEVQDNGRGIPPHVLPRIFDPFFTTKDVGKGTGLGLSIAYKIVSEHGGRIDVRSQPGEGATFTVVLPIRPPLESPAERVEELVA